MRPLLSLLCLLALATGAAQAQGAKKPLQIIYHGHSFFEIRSSKGTVIIIDPHMIEAYGKPVNLKADIAILSHSHNDHTQLGVLENPNGVKVFRGFTGFGLKAKWQEWNTTEKGIRIRTIPTYHDNVEGMKYGVNTIFALEVDGWKIVHLGDLGHTLSKKQIKDIGEVDVLMIPVGGIYTLNGSEARKVVEQLKPKEYIFPMHYGTPAFTDLLTEEEFLDGLPPREIARVRDNRIVLNRDQDRPRPLVVLLHWMPKGKK
jgi:L-ascorbate metabolism protein UlaG (beta-lactamase superfamily)